MRILLLSMPDSFEHTPVIAVRMPNGALASLAGNVDSQHHVAIADLVLAQGAVRQTVERLMRDERPDLVERLLVETLRAADWATTHLDDVRRILQHETRSGADGVAEAYSGEFHLSLHPDLSDERLSLFEQQKNFLFLHGFIAGDVDVWNWADHAPLAAARATLAKERA